jgi:hypothetical protein
VSKNIVILPISLRVMVLHFSYIPLSKGLRVGKIRKVIINIFYLALTNSKKHLSSTKLIYFLGRELEIPRILVFFNTNVWGFGSLATKWFLS